MVPPSREIYPSFQPSVFIETYEKIKTYRDKDREGKDNDQSSEKIVMAID